MANSSTVTKKLRALGLPMEMVKGEGYWYFVYDGSRTPLTGVELYDTHSEYVYRFSDHTEAEWVRIGVAFACKLLTQAVS